MTTVLYVLLAILIFGVLIAIHEFGHFIAAKACGVRIEEFAVGMGPVLWKKQKGETQYSLRLVPIGGFCAMAGEDRAMDDPRAFTSQPPWKRVIILAAGAFMNFVLGFLIVVILYAGIRYIPVPGLTGFMEGCPYEGETKLMTGDVFYSINGRRTHSLDDVLRAFSAEGDYDFVVMRDGQKLTLETMKLERLQYPDQEEKMFGFLLGEYAEEATPASRLRASWTTTKDFVTLIWDSLRQLVQGAVSVRDLSGPVGIVDIMAETGEQAESTSEALDSIFYLAAFIAVNLAIMNLLPIPALDGGRIFLLLVTCLVEAVTRRKLDPKYEGYIHAAGMVLLLGLMAFVMINDVVRIIKG